MAHRLLIAILCVLSIQAQDYTPTGSLKLPTDYREWVFLSSGLGMVYGPAAGAPDENPRFDNVFAKPAAWREFLKTGTWPDKTVLILEIRSSQSKASIDKGGHSQSNLLGIEAEVKENGKWTFFDIGRGTEGKPFPRTESCYSCHSQNAAVDNTFVQFYPTLLPVAAAKGTVKPAVNPK